MPSRSHRPQRIISGAQTGADRAALDAAIELGIPHGGFVPAGRKAEDGRVPDRYHVTELASALYDDRTERNVREADATLIVSIGPLTGGSLATQRFCRRHQKPHLHLDLSRASVEKGVVLVREWLDRIRPATLNIAGPRESTSPGIYDAVHALLHAVLADERAAE